MAGSTKPKFDGNKKRAFLNAVRACGYIGPAAKKVKVARSTIYEHRDSDPAFKKAIEDAIADHLDEMAAAYQDAAINGVESTRQIVQNGKLKTLKARRQWPYLLARYVERRHPDFKPAVDITFPEGGGVLAVGGTLPVDEFLAKHQPEGEPVDPGPSTVTHLTPLKRE